MSIERLIEFEKTLDQHVESLPIWQLPIRCVLLSLHMAIHSFFAKGGTTGFNAASRASALLPLLARCPAEPIGENALNAFNAYQEADPAAANMIMALNYGHFCQIMPEVHRGYYDANLASDNHFVLTHLTPAFAATEAKDILLSELAIPHLAARRPDVRREIEELAATMPQADLRLVARVQGTYVHFYLNHLVEPPLVTDAAMQAAAGVSSAEFARFQAILFALSDFANDLANALEPQVRAAEPGDPIEAEWLEWISVFWQEEFLLHQFRELAGISEGAARRLMAIFGVDFRVQPPTVEHGGDGFFPPLALLPPEGVMIGPLFVRLFVQSRNLLYALQRIDRKLFDGVVSGHLEPQLIETASQMLSELGGLELRRNVSWNGGEIDLLAFDPKQNIAMHLQAKGALPPQGARMVARLEGRVQEGLDQIRRFRALESADVDKIISRALGREVRGACVFDMLLTRSCFGTHRTWETAGDVSLITLPVLSELTRQGGSDAVASLADIPARAAQFIDAYVAQANPRWVPSTLVLEGGQVDVPMLHYDNGYVERERQRVWRERPVLGR